MTVVVTGSNGFTAHHFIEYILNHQLADQIIGIDVTEKSANSQVHKYFSATELEGAVKVFQDIRDELRVFHFAGVVGDKPFRELVSANVLWSADFLEAIRNVTALTSVLNIGSSAEYGRQTVTRVAEETTPNPLTFYGITKHLQTQLALCLWKSFALPVVCTRTFNLVGPNLSDKFVCGTLAKQFAEFKMGLRKKVKVGRTDSSRDFIDVRDAVRIYWELSNRGQKGAVYNVGTGRPTSINDVYLALEKLIGMAVPREHTESCGKGEIDSQSADVSRLENEKLTPMWIPMEESLRAMIDHWLSVLH